MQAAREARLALKRIRVNADKTRKLLKEDSLRYGKAVQGVYNVIEYLVKPIEQYLEDQEKFAEREKARMIEELKDKRLTGSLPYEDFLPTGIDFGTISEEDYTKMLNFAKDQKQKHEAEQKRLEEERLLNEKLDRIERDRKYSLAPFSDFVDASKLDLRNMSQEEFDKIEDKAISDKKAHQQEQERVRLENERLKKEAEEKERKAKEEKRKRLAPDKEKLLGLADLIDSLEMPTLSNDKSAKVLENVKTLLGKTTRYLRENSDKL